MSTGSNIRTGPMFANGFRYFNFANLSKIINILVDLYVCRGTFLYKDIIIHNVIELCVFEVSRCKTMQNHLKIRQKVISKPEMCEN